MPNSKSDYRQYFANVKDWLKMNYFLKIANVDQPNFSRFMKGDQWDYLISKEKLERLYEVIQKKLA